MLREKLKELRANVENFEGIVIQVGSSTCENAAGAPALAEEFRKHIRASGREDIKVNRVGCTGRCSLEPIVSVLRPGEEQVVYQQVDVAGVHEIFVSHVLGGESIEKYCLNKEEEKRSGAQELLKDFSKAFFEQYGDKPFYNRQSRIALRNAGIIDPVSICEYVMRGGFESLALVLEKNDPEWVVERVKKSNLRGRGGGGYPTGLKWSFARKSPEKERYIICNADEGDPGAFMDRSMLESDPFSVIEGMIIAGFAIEASKGYFYIRAEYPLAIERITKALEVCRKHGILGEKFDLEIKMGAGAFVCGEETALLQSIEGKRGQPRLRPPYPAERGLWGKPTIINNVETLANIPAVIALGDVFAKIGTKKSGGTKVFALAGKLKNSGLVEVPMGTTLREIIYDIGGGILGDKELKAIQTGGPAGGFIPASKIDTPIDYDTLAASGSMMGSGGMIVLDEDDCIVDVTKFYLGFTLDESCGKCTPCREGTKRLYEILERITAGKGVIEDIEKLERLSTLLKNASLCGLGKAAPNPVLSSLKEFRDEYMAHIVDKRCPARRCVKLTRYEIMPDKCIGCGACARVCPERCISGVRKRPHCIDQNRCIKCGSCYETCRFGAIKKT
jgi:NADH:ubiquinone oxidoreductase subunit F (NADH-binding)/(2Fe-2S) ferredoxin/Pyruvate/2-oxoacid:ferredoxin oxidoreductase delta subunit